MVLRSTAWCALFCVAWVSQASLADPGPATRLATTFVLRVLDGPSDRPVAGAAVEADYDESPTFKGTTDADGRVVFHPPADALFMDVRVAGPARVPVRVWWKPPEEPGHDRLDLHLAAGVTVGGRVLDDAGRPLPDAHVDLRYAAATDDDTPWPHTRIYFTGPPVVTGPDGRWTYAGAPADLDRLRFAAWRHGSVNNPTNQASYGPDMPLPAAALRDGSAVLKLPRGVRLGVRAVDAQGLPVAGALVTIGRQMYVSYNVPPAVTDADGRVTLAAVADRAVTLTASAPGHAPERTTFVVPVSDKDLTLTLGPPHALAGRVLDRAGRPVAGARVYMKEWRGGGILPDPNRTTDTDGRFAWADMPDDGMTVNVAREDYADRADVPVQAGRVETITLASPLRVHGTVVDAATGRPVTGVRVATGNVLASDQKWWARGPFCVNSPTTLPAAASTFVQPFTTPTVGHVVRVEAPGYMPHDSPVYAPDAGDVDFTFRLSPGNAVAGTLVDSAGRPVADATLVVVLPGNPLWIGEGTISTTDAFQLTAKSGPDGRFDFGPQPPPFRVVATSAAGWADVSDTHFLSGSVVPLTPWAVVEGDATVNGRPAAGAGLSARPVNDVIRRNDRPQVVFLSQITADAGGHFVFNRLTDAPVRIARNADFPSGGWASAGPVTLTPTPGGRQRVRLGRDGRTVRGKVGLPETLGRDRGRIARGVMVPLADPTTRPGFVDLSSEWAFGLREDNTFRVDDVPAGRYAVRVELYGPTPPDVCGTGAPLATAEGQVVVPSRSAADAAAVDVPPMTAAAWQGLTAGQTAPPVDVPSLDGGRLSLADHRGRVVLLDFWATWCGPCVAELPRLKAVHDRFGRDGRFVLLGLSLDDTADDARTFKRAHDMAWPQGYAGAFGAANPTVAAYGLSNLPSLWLVDADGRVLAKDLTGDTVEAAVAAALDRPPTTRPTPPVP